MRCQAQLLLLCRILEFPHPSSPGVTPLLSAFSAGEKKGEPVARELSVVGADFAALDSEGNGVLQRCAEKSRN